MVKNMSKTDPMEVLLMSAVMGSSGYIEGQEAAGQREIVNNEVLPTQGSNDPMIRAFGVKIGKPVAGDPLFCEATLPAGWKREGSDHAMWSYIVDEKGRRRVAIFYKAAFYDRDAHMSPCRRFTVQRDYERIGQKNEVVLTVTDCGATVFASSVADVGVKPENQDARRAWYLAGDETEKRLRAECVAWLDEHHPEHKDADTGWSKAP